MPGGRLNRPERRVIAAGLAEGLGYAEIARRLGRPTSTVSREVARNGGPSGYRSDRAQRAAERRAHRRGTGTVTSGSEPSDAGAHGRDSEQVSAFLEEFAAMIVQVGLPRMAARVLACLFTTDAGTLTAAELVRRLRVSPASVSKAVGYLESLEMIRRERDVGRRDRYVLDDDVWTRAWRTSVRTNALWAETTRRGADLLGPATPAGARLDGTSRFFATLSDDMSAGLEEAALMDVLVAAAALVHAAAPLTVERLAAALGWAAERVAGALRDAERHPATTDPVALVRSPTDTYTATASPARLTAAQRAALRP